MKSTGIVRHIDELGRIVIPKEMRKKMDLASSDPVEIYVDKDKIILTKYCPSCTFCQSEEDVKEFKGRKICKKCLAELKQSV
jgi:transcriptional pleiotropic regulator of transition state genes